MVACPNKNTMKSKQKKIASMVIIYHFSKFKNKATLWLLMLIFLRFCSACGADLSSNLIQRLKWEI